MSYVALATDAFEEVAHFYGVSLGFPVVANWDRPNGRGCRFDLGQLCLEILDNRRKRTPLDLYTPGGRVHIVIEVDDADEVRKRIPMATPVPERTSWGATLFAVKDPDGVPVTFLQWSHASGGSS